MDVNGLKEYHDTPDTERAYRDMRNFAAADVGGIECVGAALLLASSDSYCISGGRRWCRWRLFWCRRLRCCRWRI